MKKLNILFSIVSTAFLLSAANALADPNIVEVGVTCPDASGVGTHTLSNFGSRIAGYGHESFNGVAMANSPYFSYHFTSGDYPARIADGAYSSVGVDYDPTTATISCRYASAAGYDAFAVTFQMINGNGSVLLSKTNDTIILSQYIGKKK